MVAAWDFNTIASWDGTNTQLPPPSHNGGLYTGEPFNGPWGNVPVVPDAVSLTNKTLKLASPPPPLEATVQFDNTFRPGNNQHNILSPNYQPNQIACTLDKNIEKSKQICKSYDPFQTNYMTL